MAIDTSASAEACLEAAERLGPRIRELAPAIEREGRLPPALVEEMRSAGLFHLLLPRDLGGLEVDPVTAARVVEAVSAADGSAGWCVMIAAQNASFAGMLPKEEALTVWGNGAIVCGTANPVGRATWTMEPEPGYRVSGRWGFASGSSHADWFVGESMLFESDGEPRRNAAGEHVSRVLLFPRSEVTVYQTWNTTGLRGTASNDFSVDGAFVPAARGFQMLVTPPQHEWALYRALPLVFINHGAQALGLARGAIESGIAIARRKRGWGGVPLNELARVQAAVAQATALVDSASEYFYAASQRLWDSAKAGQADAELRARVRLATSNAAAASVQAVDIMHTAVGTAAIFAENPIERQFRDIHTAVKHVMIGQLTYEAAGRVLLGMEASFPFF
jgi:alkylation response protein AidB-like acyl-CoA dehydrogenase